MIEVDPARTMMTLSAETSLLIRRLRSLSVEEVVSYEELSELIGRDVRRFRSPLDTARLRVLKDDYIHTDVVRTVGIKRISTAEGASSGAARALRRVRAAARRGRTIVSRVKLEEVPQTDRAVLFARSSLLDLVDNASSAKVEAKATAAVTAGGGQELPFRKLLADL